MRDEDIKIGSHCWALFGGELLVVLKEEAGAYQVCGPWECGMKSDQLEILSVIPRPEGHDQTKLYYLD